MANSFGNIFKFTSFGESHGAVVGGVIDGCPSGLKIDTDFVQAELDRRRPGQSALTTQRHENDRVQFLSGLFEGYTTGTPIAFTIANENQQSDDYEALKHLFRPSHADYTYQVKYGRRDYRGGGRASARETAGRIVAGAVAKLALQSIGVEITAYTSQIGTIKLTQPHTELHLQTVENNAVRCPDKAAAEKMTAEIAQCQANGDSIGGIVTCVVRNVPVGLGEPIYNKLQAELAHAMLSINAAKGFDYGSGFDAIGLHGSEVNDAFKVENGHIVTATNHSGGIQGGISNGADIYFRVAFKPTPTIAKVQTTVDTDLNAIEIAAHGRHDACVVPRAVPVVEAMTAIVLFDAYLAARCARL